MDLDSALADFEAELEGLGGDDVGRYVLDRCRTADVASITLKPTCQLAPCMNVFERLLLVVYACVWTAPTHLLPLL